MLVHFNSRYRLAKYELTSDYQTRLPLPNNQINVKKVRVINTYIPNSIINIDNYVFVWSEPSGGAGAQVEKSVTFPQGQYTLDSFCSTFASLTAATSSLPTPVFSVAGSSIDSKLIFALPTTAGVPVSAWQIKWTKCSPQLTSICGFGVNPAEDTTLSATSFISPNTYNFGVPGILYCNIDIFPAAIIPGANFRAVFPIYLANSGLVSLNDGLSFNMSTILTSNQNVRITLLTDEGKIANLRSQDWALSLLLE